MQKYNKEKLENFNRRLLEDYYSDLFIEKITDVHTTEKTDGSFTQVGFRPLVEEDMFIAPNYSVDLPMAGKIVALGERDLLVNELLNDNCILPIKIKAKEFTPNELQKVLEPLENAKILIPINIKSDILKNSEWAKRITFIDRQMKFDYYYDIIPISTKDVDNKIIILDKFALMWTKKVFLNEITDKKEKIDIQIGKKQSENKIDILIRSVNKFIYYKDLIKIIEIE